MSLDEPAAGTRGLAEILQPGRRRKANVAGTNAAGRLAANKPQRTRSAAGAEIRIPKIRGDGAREIGKMRGEILRANIAKALEGSHLHMKALFEYAKLWPAGNSNEMKAEDSSLAAILLARLGVNEQAGAGQEKF